MQRLSSFNTRSRRARYVRVYTYVYTDTVRIYICVCVDAPTGRIEGVYNAFESARTVYRGRGQKGVAVCTMDIDGGTFHCATMLCGNNAQTNDSVVAVVITDGVRSA